MENNNFILHSNNKTLTLYTWKNHNEDVVRTPILLLPYYINRNLHYVFSIQKQPSLRIKEIKVCEKNQSLISVYLMFCGEYIARKIFIVFDLKFLQIFWNMTNVRLRPMYDIHFLYTNLIQGRFMRFQLLMHKFCIHFNFFDEIVWNI